MDIENDWAFVCPLTGSASEGMSIYVSGVHRVALDSEKIDIQGDIKFAELIGATLDNLRQVRTLERRQSSLRPFFSAPVLDAFVQQDPQEVLAPRECDISVLFCDLRGFSLATEQMANRLIELLERVSDALGVVTSHVLQQKGVIGDFHGDSAMGFWGWPIQQQDMAERTARAALGILSEMNAPDANSEMPDFTVGIGIATGNAVAGKIGTQDQVKVTAFGPTVNLAARLEGMTRQIQAAILIDQNTAAALEPAGFAMRKLGNYQPFGLKSPSVIYELLTNDHTLTSEMLTQFDHGLVAFEKGDWNISREVFSTLAPHDGPSRFLLDYINQRELQCPADFNGVIELSRK